MADLVDNPSPIILVCEGRTIEYSLYDGVNLQKGSVLTLCCGKVQYLMKNLTKAFLGQPLGIVDDITSDEDPYIRAPRIVSREHIV
jgi:hypothetical protein